MSNNTSPYHPMNQNPYLQVECPSCNNQDSPMRIDEIDMLWSLELGLYTLIFDVNATCEKCSCTANFIHSVLITESILIPVDYSDKWLDALEEIGEE